ncbi:MAG: trypsin-like serine protease [Planctomycetota bacterium]
MSKLSKSLHGLCLLGATVFAVPVVQAQTHMEEQTEMSLYMDTGWAGNTGTQRAVVASFTVSVPGSSWMRLYFDESVCSLGGDLFQGTGAFVRITSHADGSVQELNAMHLRQWGYSSAYFNGDAVEVDLVAYPGTGRHRVALDHIDMAWGVFGSQCGSTDDRVPSSDPRAGRLLPIGCTGWLINDCSNCALTAGHCTGNINVLEFNVPMSTASGGLVHPPASDQYAVDPSSIQSNGGQGIGNDWGYFGTFPNSNTGLTAAEAQGSTYILGVAPAPAGNTIRVTGFGTDSTPATYNQIQQTHLGPMAVNSGTALGYTTDTEGGNSGSPVIWEQTGEAIGIHTHGGCSSSGYNSGTNLNHPGLQAALASPQGVCNAGGMTVATQPGMLVPPSNPVPVAVSLTGTVVAGSVAVHYRQGAGAFTTLPLSQGAGTIWGANIPGPSCGQALEYYFSANLVSCGLKVIPAQGSNAPFSAEVGIASLQFEDHFQANLGWSTEILGATSGGWQRGVPVNDAGWAYDPASDSDGSGMCYLTQNAVGNTDVDGGAVRLTSPVIDLQSGASVYFDYYLFLSDPNSTDHLLVEMSSNGTTGPWIVVADITADGGLDWHPLEISAGQWGAAGLTASANARIRFTANDSDPQTIVEAGIDNVRVGSVQCGGSGPINTTFCGPANLHSGGVSGTMRGFGSQLALDNDLTLIAENLPLNQFAYFLVGSAVGFQPNVPGSQGILCLGGTLGRFNGFGQFGSTGVSGSIQMMVDLTAPPPEPAHAVQSGEIPVLPVLVP